MILLRCAALAAMLALAGCATNSQTANIQIAPRIAQQSTADAEDDGLPAQAPPPARIRAAPDDPSEPYSRNYGGTNPSATPAQQRAPIPHDLPPEFRKKLLAAAEQAAG